MELALYTTRLKMQNLAERNKYEWNNILDRMMINLYNGADALEKARDECREKRIDATLVDRAEQLLRDRKPSKKIKFKSSMLPDKITREMYVFLKQRYPRVGSAATREDMLARCVLRYASLGQGGQQWALNRTLMDEIRKRGISLEAFASPFNNYFEKYFSIFQGDEPFGSLGSFFTISDDALTEMVAKTGLYANPPFTPAALTRMSERVAMLVARLPKVKIVIITPTWTDAAWYQRLAGMFSQKLKRDETYTTLGEEFRPKFTTTMWTRNVEM